MGRRLNHLLAPCWLLALLLPLLLQAKVPDLHVWLEPTICGPGDIVELHAQMEATEFAEFDLQIPKHDSLVLIDQHRTPVAYLSGTYTMKSTWTFQPIEPGAMQIEGIRATIQRGEQSSVESVATLLLQVETGSVTTDSEDPLPLPAAIAPDALPSKKPILWILIAVGALLTLPFFMRRRTLMKRPHRNDTAPAPLAELETGLASHQIDRALIAEILNNPTLQLSGEFRAKLEAAIYRKNDLTNADTLLISLRQERTK